MDMVCPECYGALDLVDGVTARCACEGRRFRILFARQSAAAGPPPPPLPAPAPPAESVITCPHCQKRLKLTNTHLGKRVRCPACRGEFPAPEAVETGAASTCRRHPNKPADRTCATCGTSICSTCAFPQPDGVSLCPDCVSRPRAAAVRPAPPPLPGIPCARHPNVAAVRRCKVCSAGVCATCDFELPGEVHVCPTCVSAPSRKMSRKRKANLAWSYVLGIWSVVGIIVLLSGALAGSVRTRADLEMVGSVVGFLVFAPAIIGTALGFAALDRRLGNPPVVWVAVIGNSVVLAALVLIEIIGAMM